MEIDLERQQRINAPIQLVWDEVDSLDQLLAKSPQISSEVIPGSDRGSVTATLQWGPLKWTIEGAMQLEEIVPLERISVSIAAPSLEIDARESLELKRLGDTDTRLTLRGHMVCRHRFGNRMKGVLAEVLEGQMVSIVGRTKTRAEQRQQAQDRLLR
jgi:carbon monoxide dehydrogenase subunit G